MILNQINELITFLKIKYKTVDFKVQDFEVLYEKFFEKIIKYKIHFKIIINSEINLTNETLIDIESIISNAELKIKNFHKINISNNSLINNYDYYNNIYINIMDYECLFQNSLNNTISQL